ncbi:hypothetical protein B0H13DRAFT_1907286 [Mycena leptocephala]|nr:hypothetical protein B0H13DRAFT_1907286 [Mycena leptocephala]
MPDKHSKKKKSWLSKVGIIIVKLSERSQDLCQIVDTANNKAISNTTQALLKNIPVNSTVYIITIGVNQLVFQTIKQNRNNCIELLEDAYKLLNAVLMVHLKLDAGGALAPSMLSHIGKFTETLHKVHIFVEAQQKGSKFKSFFRQGEMSTLLKECKAGLQQGFVIFEIDTANIMKDITEMQEDAENRHKAVCNMIEALSDTTAQSSTSISMLLSEPKIFHGRESELSDILCLFGQGSPRIVILGGGGMGKTSLARVVIHHSEIAGRYEQQRFFVACDSATSQVELADLIGTHLGLKPGKDLTHRVIQHFSSSPHSLLILDNLETLWEPMESRANIEEFLSLLTGVEHLALVITMRGAERPAKVAWTRPFLQPLKPLDQDAAQQTFIDIADNTHNTEEVNKVLSLTGNMPLAISLLAHLADSEGCSNVLSRWEDKKTSLISDGYDKRSNLDLSISLSLSSTRLNSVPHSKDLLSLLSMLPDGLSDAELVQAKLPIDNILGCKAALLQTTLAYSDGNKRLKALVPIREYMQKVKPPGFHLARPLLKHFKELLELFMQYRGTQSSSATVARISSNYSNIQNILWNGAQLGHPDLINIIYCACDLNSFSQLIGRGTISFTAHIPSILPQPCNHHLEAYYILSLFNSFGYSSISVTETLVFEALEHLKHFDDLDLKCRLYNALTDYYRRNFDISTAKKFSKTSISLALSTGNTKMQSQALTNLAWIDWYNGDYFTAQVHGKEAQRLARISADLHDEAQALHIASMCWYALGNYKQSIFLCSRARDIIALCGMSSGQIDHNIMTIQAEIHKLKSEYVAARSIHFRILQETSVTQDFYAYATALLNMAEIDVAIGAPKEDVQGVYEKARGIFNTAGHLQEVTMCDTILADLYLREGNFLPAKTLFESCLKPSSRQPDIMSYCLERLGNVSHWSVNVSSWTTVFLVHSVQRQEQLGIHKALQFLGDTFLAQEDEHTAINLFTVALEGFSYMDVHHSRAECMLRLGDISKGHSDLLKAVEFWTTARPLFEQSSQVKQVENIDQRLAGVSEDVLEQHRKNLACLAELNVPSGTVDEINDLSDIEDMEGLDLQDETTLDPVALTQSELSIYLLSYLVLLGLSINSLGLPGDDLNSIIHLAFGEHNMNISGYLSIFSSVVLKWAKIQILNRDAHAVTMSYFCIEFDLDLLTEIRIYLWTWLQ